MSRAAAAQVPAGPDAHPVPLLEVHDLAIRYEGADAFAPAGASFQVRAGEAVLLLGPSGCGKSTLTLALNGLIPHDIEAEVRGRVEVGGLDAATTPVATLSTRVGMVFQDPDAQMVTATVLDEVAFGPENLRLPVEDVLSRTESALRRVGLWERREQNPDALSGGGRQRLAIAAALALGSPVLVLDEPTANLDPAGIDEVYDALGEVVASGERAVVLVEHNLDAAVRLATRVVVLDASGLTVADGTVDAVLRGQAARLHGLGVWLPTSTLAALRLRRAGYTLEPMPLTPSELRARLEACLAPVPSRAPAPTPPFAHTSPHRTHTNPPNPHAGARGFGEPVWVRRGGGTAGDGSAVAVANTAAADATSARGAAADAAAAPLIQVRGLTLRRGRAQVLHGIDLDIHPGEFVAIVGANGAGKTSLVQAIAGVIRPPRGTVRIDGQDLSRISPRRLGERIGFVFQNPEHQFIAHTVHDELAHGLRHLPPEDAERRIADILDRFGLSGASGTHPFLLSGGQKRRLSVGTALVAGAPVLALDEPTFGQDRARADELMELLGALNAEGTTVIVVTHDMQLVTEHATRTVLLGGGRVLADGPTAQVFAARTLIESAGLRLPPLREALSGLARHPELAGVARLADLPGARIPDAAAADRSS